MNNKLSISILAAAFFMTLGGAAYALDSDGIEDNFSYEMSADELQSIKDDCNLTGADTGMQDEELAAFIDECISVNTMVTTDDMSGFPEDDMEVVSDGSEMFDDTEFVEGEMLEETELPFEDNEG